MTIADPALLPVTAGATRGALVAPSGMEKFGGHTIAIEELLLASAMDTPPGGAAVPNATGKFTVLPGVTVTLEDSRMPPAAGCVTVTPAVALATFGALAAMATDPADTPVTGTATLVIPVPKLTVAGVVATLTLLELRLMASPAGAGADRFSVRFCVAVPLIVRFPGEKLIVVVVVVPPPVTSTCPLAVAYPGAEAVIVADPALLPVTAGATRGALVAPSGMEKSGGHTIAIEELLLASVMGTPPAGAEVPNATGKLTVSPGAKVTFPGRIIPPDAGCVTVTLAVALAMFVALAVIVTDPADTPVTGTDTVAMPVPKLTVAGTVATVAELELRLTTSPAGAGADRFSVRFCVADPLIVRLPGQKLIVVAVVPPDVTSTCPWAVAYPGAETVIIADPALLPVTVGATRGALVAPSGMKKFEGHAMAIEELLLASVMGTPPAGAAVPNVTGKLSVSPGVTVTFAGRSIPAVWRVHCSWEKSAGTLSSICSVNVLLLVT